MFVDFYHELLDKTENRKRKAHGDWLENGNVLSIEHQLALLQGCTMQNIHYVMFFINGNKSSGSDGYGSGFLRET